MADTYAGIAVLWKDKSQSILWGAKHHNRSFENMKKRKSDSCPTESDIGLRDGTEEQNMGKDEKKNKPVKKFQAGGIQVAMWMNEGKDDKDFASFTMQKSYYDKKDEEYKISSSYGLSDLPVIAFLCGVMAKWAIESLSEPSKKKDREE